MLLVGRFIIGIGIGIANVACSTYVAETSIPISVHLIVGIPTQRALLTASFNNSYWIGAIIAGGVTFAMKDVPNNWAWRLPSMVNISSQSNLCQIQAFPALLSLACLPFIPESPRWLFYQGKSSQVPYRVSD
jgi:MFS family permease